VWLQSLTAGVDLEDLGMHCMDKKMKEHKDISLPKDTVFPAWLRDYNQVSSQAHMALTNTSKHAFAAKDSNMLPCPSQLQQSCELCGILGILHACLVQ